MKKDGNAADIGLSPGIQDAAEVFIAGFAQGNENYYNYTNAEDTRVKKLAVIFSPSNCFDEDVEAIWTQLIERNLEESATALATPAFKSWMPIMAHYLDICFRLKLRIEQAVKMFPGMVELARTTFLMPDDRWQTTAAHPNASTA